MAAFEPTECQGSVHEFPVWIQVGRLPDVVPTWVCPMAVILQFLQDIFDEEKSPSTLKVHLKAISVCHVKIDSVSPGALFLVGQFFKGTRLLRPLMKDLVPH